MRRREDIVAIATVVGVIIAAIALIPSFGQWLFPHSPIPEQVNTPSVTSISLSPTQVRLVPVLTEIRISSTPANIPMPSPSIQESIVARTETPIPPAPTTTLVPPIEAPLPITTQAPKPSEPVKGFDPSKIKKISVEGGAILRVSGWGNTAEQKVTRDMLDRFQQVYPGIEIKYEPVPDDFDNKLQSTFESNAEPDVFYLSPRMSDKLIYGDRLLDLAPAMSETGVKKSDYIDTLINIFSRGDKVYGLPKDFGSIAVFYNTNMATNAGLLIGA